MDNHYRALKHVNKTLQRATVAFVTNTTLFPMVKVKYQQICSNLNFRRERGM
jgi:hypothetical protein